jgi:hypothetical protein
MSTIKLRVAKYDPKKNKIVLEDPKDMLLVAAAKDCKKCCFNWSCQRWMSLLLALGLFYSFMTAWMVAHIVGLHATLPDDNAWNWNHLVMGEPRNDDFSVDAIHPANKLVRNQIKELKGNAGTVYSWTDEKLDPTPWLEPNMDYYEDFSWGETGTREEHGRSDNKENKIKERSHWKNYKEQKSHFTNKVYNFKRALERKNTICWNDDDEVKKLTTDQPQSFADYSVPCRYQDMKYLLSTKSNPLYTSAKRHAQIRKPECSAKQQLRVSLNWRTRVMKKALHAECFLMDQRKLPSPNTAGYRYNTGGKEVYAEQFNQQLLTFAKVTIGSCSDPYAEQRVKAEEDIFTSGGKTSTATCQEVEYNDISEIGWETQEQYEAKTDYADGVEGEQVRKGTTEANSPCRRYVEQYQCKDYDSSEKNKAFKIEFPKGSYAPHIVEFDVKVTPRRYNGDEECHQYESNEAGEKVESACWETATSKSEFFPNMLEAWVMCKVTGDNSQGSKSPYRFVDNDQPEFWKVPGINKFQFRFGYDFNKHLDSSERTSESDENPNYPRPALSTPASDGYTFSLNNGQSFKGGKLVEGPPDADIVKAFDEDKASQAAALLEAMEEADLADFDQTKLSKDGDSCV